MYINLALAIENQKRSYIIAGQSGELMLLGDKSILDEIRYILLNQTR
jgi:hypothetical protein